MALITTADYQEIREIIDITLTLDELPNEQIGRDAFVGQAQRLVLARDPEAESRTGDELASVRLAALYYAAALLCPTIPILKTVRSEGESIERNPPDLIARAAELRAQAVQMLDSVLTPTTASVPYAFGVAPGYRGR